MDTIKIYQYALQREQKGRDFFRENAQRFSHAAVSGAFEQLAQEEEKHIAFIEQLIAQLEAGEPGSASDGADLERDGFFSQRAASEMLDQTVIESMVPSIRSPKLNAGRAHTAQIYRTYRIEYLLYDPHRTRANPPRDPASHGGPGTK